MEQCHLARSADPVLLLIIGSQKLIISPLS